MDIPITKKQCFAQLDEMLSEADKQAISPEILKIYLAVLPEILKIYLAVLPEILKIQVLSTPNIIQAPHVMGMVPLILSEGQ